MGGTLFVVGTPIGNLEDLSDRAKRVLGEVELVAAEDTRRTGRLLASIGVRARQVSFFEGNEERRIAELIETLSSGSDVALVSDAGMPGVSDPGYRLVAACLEGGIEVDVIPGPSAPIVALVASGLPTDRFVFEGFLPRSGRRRAERLAALAVEPRTIVMFESPRRLAATLEDLADACGDRRAAVCRELTKLNQEVVRGSLLELVARYADGEPKGEIVLVVEGAPEEAGSGDIGEAVRLAGQLAVSGVRTRDAARTAARRMGVPVRSVYEALLAGRPKER